MRGMITRSEIQAAVKVMKGRNDTPSSAANEFKETYDPQEVTRRWVVAVCKFFMEDMPVSQIAQHSNCDEALVGRILEEHLEGYLEGLEDT